ncbi:MAG: monooxygenase FAD-binding protein [Thermoleophilia bacterium]|nr:monooxygenase FAD-binding protein [Thermoleophilia bacterium]
MTSVIRSAARELPVIVAGAGPAGTTTALGLHAAGEAVLVFEARGPVATRARNIFLRPQARDILQEVGLPDPGRDTTIMSIENDLRGLASERGVPVAYDRRVLGVVEHTDHVAVTVQGPRGGISTVKGRALVDASGGRIAATETGDLERVATGPHHVYVTAQYASPARFDHVYGAFDRARSEGMVFFPVANKTGFVAYYDLPPGVPIGDEAALLARYEAIAGRLELGPPVAAPQAFDARQHLSRSASRGRILKIGDSAGNADPYIGAGAAAALVDARSAVRALTRPGDDVHLVGQAAEDVLAGHRNLGAQAGMMVRARSLALRSLPDVDLGERLTASDLRPSRFLDLTARLLTHLPITSSG